MISSCKIRKRQYFIPVELDRANILISDSKADTAEKKSFFFLMNNLTIEASVNNQNGRV